jgi:Ran GTPase-activating protein (RanGAP) involved in mRNA processing and transport
MPAVLTKWNTCVTIEGGQKAVAGNAVMTSLILDENAIAGQELAALREMLAKNTHIVLFSILNNPKIHPQAAEALARIVAPESPE